MSCSLPLLRVFVCMSVTGKQSSLAHIPRTPSWSGNMNRNPKTEWNLLGTFQARAARGVQSFPLDEHVYARFIKVRCKHNDVVRRSILYVFGVCRWRWCHILVVSITALLACLECWDQRWLKSTKTMKTRMRWNRVWKVMELSHPTEFVSDMCYYILPCG